MDLKEHEIGTKIGFTTKQHKFYSLLKVSCLNLRTTDRNHCSSKRLLLTSMFTKNNEVPNTLTFHETLTQLQSFPLTNNLFVWLEFSFPMFSSRMNFIIAVGDLVKILDISFVLICWSIFHLQYLAINDASPYDAFVLDILLVLFPFRARTPLSFSDKVPLRWWWKDFSPLSSETAAQPCKDWIEILFESMFSDKNNYPCGTDNC